MKWYKHDANANMDAKLKRVRLKYGLEGYGLYWYCLELIAQTVEPHNLTFELEHDAEIISADTGIHYELVQEMMSYMVDLGLFEQQDGIITCLKLAKRADEYTAKLIRNLPSVPTNSGQTPDKVPPIRIEQKRTEKKRTEKKRTERKKPAKRVPPKWELSDGGRAFAKDCGMSNAVLVEQLGAFRDYEYPKAKTDFDACWRTWCRNWRNWNPGEATVTQEQKTYRQPTELTPEQRQRDREKAERELAALMEARK